MKLLFAAVLGLVLTAAGWAAADDNSAAATPDDQSLCRRQHPAEMEDCAASLGYYNKLENFQFQAVPGDEIRNMIDARPRGFSKKYLDRDQAQRYFGMNEAMAIKYFELLHQER